MRAVEIERMLTKDEILSLYLDLAPYGGNIEGVRAASLAYFGKEPRRLTLGEAALLVALPQSPEVAAAGPLGRGGAQRARDRVLDRFAARGTRAGGRDRARQGRTGAGRAHADAHAGAACGRSARSRKLRRAAKSSAHHRRRRAEEARRTARASAPARSAPISRSRSWSSTMRPAKCGARRLADYFDARRAGQVDMTQALRSPGSTLKPFIYGLGFEDGFDPSRDADRRPADRVTAAMRRRISISPSRAR